MEAPSAQGSEASAEDGGALEGAGGRAPLSREGCLDVVDYFFEGQDFSCGGFVLAFWFFSSLMTEFSTGGFGVATCCYVLYVFMCSCVPGNTIGASGHDYGLFCRSTSHKINARSHKINVRSHKINVTSHKINARSHKINVRTCVEI